VFTYIVVSQDTARVACNILLKLIFLIRRHNDLPWNVRKFVHNQLGEVNLSSDLGRVDPWARSDWSHTDIPRLRAGLVGAQVNSTWHSLAIHFLPFLSVDRYFHLAFFAEATSVPAISSCNFYVNSCYVTHS